MWASLPMYYRPEVVEAHADFWAAIRDHLRAEGVEAPEALDCSLMGIDAWQRADMLLSQTCGMPYRLALHGKVQIVGTPDYGLDGCAPGYYCSPLVVRKAMADQPLESFRRLRFAYNGETSQSGFAAPLNHVAALGWQFEQRVVSGGHLASAQMLAAGDADIAALDGVTWRLIERYEPEISGELAVLGWTDPTPGLPYICAQQVPVEKLRAAVQSAIDQMAAETREVLGIRALVQIDAEAYLAVPNPV